MQKRSWKKLGFLKALGKMFSVPAPIIFVTGRMGKGKTNFSLLLCELALMNRWVKHVATNIKVFDEKFIYITSWNKLDSWLKSNRKKKLYNFDEASSNISRRTPLARLNRKIIDLAFKLRKYKAHLIVDAVSRGLVDSTFEAIPDLVLGEFRKISRHTAILYSPLFDEPMEIHNIPSTTVKFDTYDIAPFTLTCSDEELQMPCCKVAKLYAELHNLSKVSQRTGLFRQQVKYLLIKHIQHTLGNEVTKRDEDNIIKVDYNFGENNVDFTLKSNVKR